MDQAEGLRQWADEKKAPKKTAKAQDAVILLVMGLQDTGTEHRQKAHAVLERWAEAGKKWVGNPDGWEIHPVWNSHPNIEALALEHPRWALWVDTDRKAFMRAYQALKACAANNGPKRLIVLHPGIKSRRGLLGNLQAIAAQYFGIELLIFDA